MGIKQATGAEWRSIGEQTKLVRREVLKLVSMVSPFVSSRVAGLVAKNVILQLDKFRSEAEDEMFQRGGPKDTSIFYGEKEFPPGGGERVKAT